MDTDPGLPSEGSQNEGALAAETGVLLALLPPTGAEDEQPLNRRPELPLSLNLRTVDGSCFRLIARGEPLPANFSGMFTTVEDDQSVAWLELLVGERPLCDGNMLLGAVELSPLPVPSYRSFVQIEVVVKVSADFTVVLTAAEVESRALGEAFAHAEWQGHILEALPAPPGRREGSVAPFSHGLAKHLPVLLATRTVRLAGRDVIIRQHRRREEERIGTGGVLWEAAIALADHVGRSRAAAWRGRRVLELGAGTGLVAIALALEGAEVLATDGNPRVLEGAGQNAASVGAFPAPGRVELGVFDWNSPADLQKVQEAGPWDAIVGSDLVYPGNAGRRCVESNSANPPADATLLKLLASLAGASTEVVLALKDRTGEVGRFVQAAESAGWTIRRAAKEDVMPDFRSMETLAILRLYREAPHPDSKPEVPTN
mmetsp:Transcript_13503/g.28160  ORF Transcript_13503/g.28160 Transcript_13503/m.28160 type:complete len:429 (+) Transcript_13503:1-1287(+)